MRPKSCKLLTLSTSPIFFAGGFITPIWKSYPWANYFRAFEYLAIIKWGIRDILFIMNLVDNTVISASAGSGKTFRLTLRYIKLLNQGVPPEKIIALTFTKKAAGEIFNKIVDRLLIWYEKEDVRVKDCEVDKIEGMTKARVFELLKKIIGVQHRISVSTLDSFFFKVLQSFPYEYGIDSKLELIDEESSYIILDNTLRNLLLKDLSDETKDSLFEAFKQATFGKEEVSVYKTIEDFIKNHYAIYKKHPDSSHWGNERILPDELKRDYHVDIDAANKMFEGKDVTSNVFNQFKDAVLKANEFTEESIVDNSVKEFFKRIVGNEGGLSSLLSASIEKKSISLKFGSKNLDFNATVLYQAIMKYLTCIFKSKLHETRGIYKALNLYNEKYLNSVQNNGLLAFDDILFFLQGMTLTAESSQEPNQLYIDYRLDSRYDHWLIDEFQDTSRVQWNVISNLIDEIMNDLTGKRSFFYVGDVKQAIYSWRGGDSYLFNSVKDKYNDRLTEEKLFKSYRSSKAIIETVNLVFDNLHKIEEINSSVIRLWKENWKIHETVKVEEGYSVVYEFDGNKSIEEKVESLLPLKEITNILKYINPLEKGLSVGILVLKNDDADEIEKYLTSKAIPCAKEGSFNLVSSPAVQLLLSLLKIIHHPGDTIALGMVELSALSECFPTEFGKIRLEETTKMLVEELCLLGFVEFTIKWVNIIKEKVLENNSKLHELRLDQTVYAAELYRNDNTDVVSFIKHIENYKIPVKTDDKCVQIITVYKAKGLEYDMVILPKLSIKSGILNTQIHEGIQVLKGKNNDQEIAVLLPPRDIATANNIMKEKIKELDVKYCYEQLCVLYVALTRAKKAMYLFSEPDSEKSKTIRLSTILNRLLGGKSISNQRAAISAPVIYEHGNGEWFMDKKKSEDKREMVLSPKKIKLICSPKRNNISPSKRTDFSALDFLADTKNTALDIGLCIHEIFEHIGWIDDCDSDFIIDNIIFSKPFDKEIVRESKFKVKEFLKNIEIRKLLSKPSGTAELWREKEFSLFIDEVWEKGRFDRVVIEKDSSGNILKATIIDYKYEEVNDSEVIKEKYSAQLNSYKNSLSYILKIPLKNIEAKLLLVNRIAII